MRFRHDQESEPMALKMLKKTEIIRLKQIEHVKSEKKILEHINHPFIVTLYDLFILFDEPMQQGHLSDRVSRLHAA